MKLKGMHLPLRSKRMNRKARLQSARYWLSKYTGNNIIKGYRQHYGVDWFSAIKELRLLGVTLDDSYVTQLQRSVEAHQKEKQSKKLKKKETIENLYKDSDETFAYIAGYKATWDKS